jgi:phosphate/sulfate permease
LSQETIALIAVVVVALAFDLMNGFHDGCNAVSTVIYTGALKPRTAIAISAVFNFAGPLIMGVAVASTSRCRPESMASFISYRCQSAGRTAETAPAVG